MRTKAILEKVYTRDTSAIIQQGWYCGIMKSMESLGLKPLLNTTIIHYLNDGVIEVWENHNSIDLLIDKIYKENLKGNSFYNSTIKQYNYVLKRLKPYWDKGILNNKTNLKKFINLVFEGMSLFAIMYYSALNDNTPEPIKSNARKIRDKDIYFDQNDKIIRKSLIKIYPRLKGLESAVLKSEITNPSAIKELKKRNKSFVFMGEKYHKVITIIEYGNENKDKLKFLIEKTPKINKNGFRGLCAYPGLIIGKVIIIKRKDQVGQVKKGDIIVSSMTTPDFIPAMKKAAAFVTDEGGITCHAAITSREMNKPCIVGTKIATKVLKDGDLVEVDANKGIVKILNNSKS